MILSKIGLENIGRVLSKRDMERKVRYIHLGNYASNIRLQRHGVLREKKIGVMALDKIFTLFGFAFPIKGYEYGIYAMDILVNQRGRKDVKLVVISGETGKREFSGRWSGRNLYRMAQAIGGGTEARTLRHLHRLSGERRSTIGRTLR